MAARASAVHCSTPRRGRRALGDKAASFFSPGRAHPFPPRSLARPLLPLLSSSDPERTRCRVSPLPWPPAFMCLARLTGRNSVVVHIDLEEQFDRSHILTPPSPAFPTLVAVRRRSRGRRPPGVPGARPDGRPSSAPSPVGVRSSGAAPEARHRPFPPHRGHRTSSSRTSPLRRPRPSSCLPGCPELAVDLPPVSLVRSLPSSPFSCLESPP
jgi:hypothetical protein